MELDTRLVFSRLNFEFQILDENLKEEAQNEYHLLTKLHSDSMDKWLHSLQVKSMNCKCGAGTLVLGEMLGYIYKKLEHIENILLGSEIKYIELKSIGHTKQLGHGYIILDEDSLEIDREYYARLFMPTFPARCMPLFGIAVDKKILKVNKMSESDLRDFDGFIVSTEREMLKSRKAQN